MDKQTKIILTLAASALIATGCTSTNSNPFAQNANQTATDSAKGTTHTHNGVAHTHPLPAGGLSHSHNFNVGTGTANTNTCVPCGTNTNTNAVRTTTQTTGANCHMHNGRQHCHPLPATGTNHTHNTGQGTQAAASTTTSSSYYDTSNSNTAYTNPVTQKGQVTHDHAGKVHSHVLPASGLNHTHNQGTTSLGNAYDTGSSTNTSMNTGNTYTVQRGDTVFQVMRNTGVNWKEIIRLNNLQAPSYQINPGQQLRLR